MTSKINNQNISNVKTNNPPGRLMINHLPTNINERILNYLPQETIANIHLVKSSWQHLQPLFYNAQFFEGTNKKTLAPVASTELFYQQKQSGHNCSIHALSNFAGYTIDRLVPATMLQYNNDYWRNYCVNTLKIPLINGNFTQENLEKMKVLGWYKEPPFSGGLAPQVITDYMNKHKGSFHLPQTCEIRAVNGLSNNIETQKTIEEIQKTTNLHRLLIFIMSPIEHISAIRKDNVGKWRVLESMSEPDQLQLRFDTLQEAVNHFLDIRNATYATLIYPTEDTIK